MFSFFFNLRCCFIHLNAICAAQSEREWEGDSIIILQSKWIFLDAIFLFDEKKGRERARARATLKIVSVYMCSMVSNGVLDGFRRFCLPSSISFGMCYMCSCSTRFSLRLPVFLLYTYFEFICSTFEKCKTEKPKKRQRKKNALKLMRMKKKKS